MVLKLVHLLWGIRVFAGRKGGVDERVVGDGSEMHSVRTVSIIPCDFEPRGRRALFTMRNTDFTRRPRKWTLACGQRGA
jgi:hypothetical protein